MLAIQRKAFSHSRKQKNTIPELIACSDDMKFLTLSYLKWDNWYFYPCGVSLLQGSGEERRPHSPDQNAASATSPIVLIWMSIAEQHCTRKREKSNKSCINLPRTWCKLNITVDMITKGTRNNIWENVHYNFGFISFWSFFQCTREYFTEPRDNTEPWETWDPKFPMFPNVLPGVYSH